MKECVFCGSFDVPNVPNANSCTDCVRLFRSVEDSLSAMAVSTIAYEDTLAPLSDSKSDSFRLSLTGERTTLPSLASQEVATAWNDAEGRETLRIPPLSMGEIARASAERGFDVDALFSIPVGPPRVWTQPLTPARRPVPVTRASTGKRSMFGLMGAFAIGTLLAVGVTQLRTTNETAAGAATFSTSSETLPDQVGSSPVIALRNAEAESERDSSARSERTAVRELPPVKVDDQTRFERAVDANPNDSEALSGLGFLARSAGDPKIANTYFERAVAANPSYLPAQLALADGAWGDGNRAEASTRYGRIVGSFAPATVPQRARERGPATP